MYLEFDLIAIQVARDSGRFITSSPNTVDQKTNRNRMYSSQLAIQSQSRQMLSKPTNPLLRCIVESLLILLILLILKKRKPMHLIFINHNFAFNLLPQSLLLHNLLNLPHLTLPQIRILLPQRNRQRHANILKIPRNSAQRQMRRIRSINSLALGSRKKRLLRCQNRVPASSAKPHNAYFLRAKKRSHLADEIPNHRSGDRFALLEKPGC
jgi:hypothetical protein